MSAPLSVEQLTQLANTGSLASPESDVLAGLEDEPAALTKDQWQAAEAPEAVAPAAEPKTETGNSAEVVHPKFLAEALKMAERGIPISFLPPGQKGSNTPGWQDIATTDAEEIIRRAGSVDRLNYACVAKAMPGGFLFLDDDGGVRAEYEKACGKMNPTLKAQSCNGSFHYTFRHSAKSLAYYQSIGRAYIGEARPDGKGELWSLRMNNAYIVGPGSIVPNKQGIDSEYKIVYNTPIIDIPDSLLDFLIGRYGQDKKAAPSINGSTIPRGSHDTALASIAGKLREAGMEEEMLCAALMEVAEKRLEDKGDDWREMVEKIARSICRYPVPVANPITIGGVPVGSSSARLGSAQPPNAAATAPVVLEPAPKIIRVPYPEFPNWVMDDTSIYEGFVKPVCAVNSRIPHFMFMPAMALLLNYVGTRVRIEFKDIIPSLFMILIGKRGQSIKSGSAEHAIEYFRNVGLVDDGDAMLKNSGGKSLVWSVGSPEGLGLEMNRLNCTNAVLYYDELTELVQKADIKSSTLGGKLLTLYESGKFQNVIKSRKESYSIPAHSYCCSFIACNTEENFTENWAKLSSGKKGLRDRYMFILQPEVLPPLKIQTVVPTHEGAKRTRDLIEKAIAQEVYKIVDDTPLRMAVGAIGNRAEIRAEKLALGFAIDLGRDEIDEDCIDRALAIIKYEKAVKNWLKSGESETWMAAHQQKARIVLERAPDGRMTVRDFQKACNAHRYDTDTWGRLVFGLVKAGIIRIEGAGTKGDPEIIQLLETMPQDDED